MRRMVFCWVVVSVLMIARISAGDTLIFVDTQGPQVTDVTLADGTSVFEPPGGGGVVESIIIEFQDPPARDPALLYVAFYNDPLAPVYYKYNYELVTRAGREVPIDEVILTLDPPVGGALATARVQLTFEKPLRTGWYTLKILDYLVDPPGNILDGETWGSYDALVFPSGDGQPGRDFICRFKIGGRR